MRMSRTVLREAGGVIPSAYSPRLDGISPVLLQPPPDAPARRSQHPDLVGFLCIITWRANDSPRSTAILATSVEDSEKPSYHNIDVMPL